MGLQGIGTDIDVDYVEFANSRLNPLPEQWFEEK